MTLAVGFFDGFHLGHQAIVETADAVLTFEVHPLSVLKPTATPPLLMTTAERLAVLGKKQSVLAIPFSVKWASLSPFEFVAWLRETYPALSVVRCGPNWNFGSGGAGNASFLRSQGIAVEEVPYVLWQNEPISSTRIRTAVSVGAWANVTAMLGRPWRITGKVVTGKGLGRTLGFPTLNIEFPEGLVTPPLGVYVVRTPYGRALANWGYAPTLKERAWEQPTLEVHLLETSLVDSPSSMWVEWLRYLRPEQKFETLEALQAQLKRDQLSAISE